MKAITTLVAALAVAIPIAPAAATSSTSRLVSYADLDLASPEGLDRLNRRIERAARQICGYDDIVTGTRIVGPEIRTCVEKARNAAKAHVAAAVEAKSRGG